ncbi:MAG: hypothetical protein ACO1SV_18845 [Fimbriimonas sp.]
MRYLLLLSLCLIALVGCGGSGSNSDSSSRIAGVYDGSWANVDDAEDIGVSSWTVYEDGRITGSDVDVSEEFFYTVFGTIDAEGNVDATTSRVGEEEVIALTGRLQRDSQGRLTGNLVWASDPPLTYTYTLTRRAE